MEDSASRAALTLTPAAIDRIRQLLETKPEFAALKVSFWGNGRLEGTGWDYGSFCEDETAVSANGESSWEYGR